MNSQNELTISSSIKVKIPEKCFYKKYTHKIVLKTDRSASVTNTWYSRRIQFNYWDVRRELGEPLLEVLREFEDKTSRKLDYRLRQEGNTITVFFEDSEIMDLLLNSKVKSHITELYKPYNKNHQTKMEIEKRLRVRKSLFIGEFRYKLYLKSMLLKKTNVQDIETWIRDAFPGENRVQANPGLERAFLSKQEKNVKWYYNTILAIYLNDETDLMIAKLRLHDYISHVEEAVLVSEL